MESITLGQILSVVTSIGAFIAGIGILLKYIKKWLKEALKDEFKGIKNDINNLKVDIGNVQLNINEVGISNCKNFLVSCFAKIEQGQELDETEKERYYEEYDAYINEYHQNSYIHTKHEKLKEEGKI